MKKIILFTLFTFSLSSFASGLVLIGNIPGKYVNSSKSYELGLVHMQDRIITDVSKIGNSGLADIRKVYPNANIVNLNTEGKFDKKANYNFIFPGMIDLHNHTKQNVLGVWDLAKGQFRNRFEWRKWKNYKYSVSGNMNPWIMYGKPITCASFRWSELQALTLGVTYLQGPSSCVSNYLVHQVEDSKAYISNKLKVQAPTDLVIPGDMTYVWQVLRPMIEGGMTYEEALAKDINETCDIPNITAENVNSSETVKILSDKKLLVEKCTKKELHSKFIRYVYWIHKTIASRKRYFDDPNHAGLIAHLAEGRRDDKYNQVEFELVKLLGLLRPHINFVHGVGIASSDFKTLAKNQMGLIWSPYSNLLLYSQTLDIKSANDEGVLLALGSDWQPTGTKGVLEELKVAVNYIDSDPNEVGLKKAFSDEDLFKMVTENPAKMINHWDIDIANKEHGIGQIAKGAMGSVIVATKLDENPYTSLVRKTWAKDINLVVVDGKIVYGNTSYLRNAQIKEDQFETLPLYSEKAQSIQNDKNIPILPEAGATKALKQEHLVAVGKYAASMDFSFTNKCGFSDAKGVVFQESIHKDKDLVAFKEATGLNLDRFADVQKLIMVNMMTQTRNLNEPSKGKVDFAVREFPPLYSCHEQAYLDRLNNFIQPGNANSELHINAENAKGEDMSSVPANMAKKYAK